MNQRTKKQPGYDEINGAENHVRLLSVAQVAAMLGVSHRTVWRWSVTVDDFPRPVKLTNATTRWRMADVVAWMDRRVGHANLR